MYAVSGRAQDAFAEMPALVQTVDGQYVQVPGARPIGFANGLQPAAAPLVVTPAPAPRTRTVYRAAPPAAVRTAPATERVVVEREADNRSWAKTAMIIGGSAGAGAGVGGIIGGKKGALIGAAIGGGGASIYEATRR
jgi:hypothetical protein